MSDVSLSKIESIIYVIRDQKITLDSVLAELYEVETVQLTKKVGGIHPDLQRTLCFS